MTSSSLTWTPAGDANSLSQDIFYKKRKDSVYILSQNVGPSVDHAVIPNLEDNVIYDFKVVNNCKVGGPTLASITSNVKLICPTVSLTPDSTHDTIFYSFANPGGDITMFVVDLLDSNGAGAPIASDTKVSPGSVVTGAISGLHELTNYKLRVTVYAGAYSKACTTIAAATKRTPTCNAPTGVVATMI